MKFESIEATENNQHHNKSIYAIVKTIIVLKFMQEDIKNCWLKMWYKVGQKLFKQ